MAKKKVIQKIQLIRLFLSLWGVVVLGNCISMSTGNLPSEPPAVSPVDIDVSNITFGSVAWHPSQDRLAADGRKECMADICPMGIYEIDILNGHVIEIAEEQGQGLPSWLAGGEYLSFAWSTLDKSGIFITSESEFSPIFFHDGVSAAWSSNGDFVAVEQRDYDEKTGNKTAQVIVLDLHNNKEETNIFQTPWSLEARIDGMAWSPDNNNLAFAATWYQSGKEMEDHLYVVDLGGKQRQLLSLDRVRYPGWLPDGLWLFFTFGKENRLAFVHTKRACIVETDITNVEYPSISPDGDTLAFTYGNIYLIDLDELLGSERQLLVCRD